MNFKSAVAVPQCTPRSPIHIRHQQLAVFSPAPAVCEPSVRRWDRADQRPVASEHRAYCSCRRGFAGCFLYPSHPAAPASLVAHQGPRVDRPRQAAWIRRPACDRRIPVDHRPFRPFHRHRACLAGHPHCREARRREDPDLPRPGRPRHGSRLLPSLHHRDRCDRPLAQNLSELRPRGSDRAGRRPWPGTCP